MQAKTEYVAKIIANAFRENAIPEEDIAQLTFHLTDWLGDLSAFVDLLEHPEKYEEQLPRVRQLLIAFLVHVPGHLRAAEKILINDED